MDELINQAAPEWEQRRYEIARAVLAALATTSDANRIGKTLLCRTAVAYADVLINTLKDTEQLPDHPTVSKMENIGKDFDRMMGDPMGDVDELINGTKGGEQ